MRFGFLKHTHEDSFLPSPPHSRVLYQRKWVFHQLDRKSTWDYWHLHLWHTFQRAYWMILLIYLGKHTTFLPPQFDFHSASLNEADVRISSGKASCSRNKVVNVPVPALDTPWSASDHQSYIGSPSLGNAVALFPNWVTFSANVIQPTKTQALQTVYWALPWPWVTVCPAPSLQNTWKQRKRQLQRR